MEQELDRGTAFLDRLSHAPGHAYILSGRDAELWIDRAAQTMLCEAEIDKPCESCRSCAFFSEGNHPDDWDMDRQEGVDDKQIRIASVRELIAWVHRAAQFGGYKTVRIKKAERLNEAAQNALLRTLEEPPERVVFFLSGEESMLLPTLRSRLTPVRLGEAENNADAAIHEEKAKELLLMLMAGQIARLPAAYMTEKEDLSAILQAQLSFMRDAIAWRLEAPLLDCSREDWISGKMTASVDVAIQWMNALYEARQRLKGNSNSALCVDRMCIAFARVKK